MQAIVELIPQGPKDEAHLVPGAVAQRVPIHVAAGEVDGAGIVLVLLHMVTDPLQHLHLGPEVWELAEPLRLVCREGEQGSGQGGHASTMCLVWAAMATAHLVWSSAILWDTASPSLGEVRD